MPGFTCCVPGCYNNSHRDRELRFYTFPKDPSLREVWLKNISRAGVSGCFSTFQPTTGHRVCSVHFPGGRKTYTIRVPTLFPLHGVNERRSRRGRGKKLALPLPLPVITSVLSVDGARELEAAATVVQIDQNGQYITPEDIGDPGEAPCAQLDEPEAVHKVEEESGGLPEPGGVLPLVLCGDEHSYSLNTGTTAAELLRKLNEQRDIIALMEVKMKEMKNTIRQLRLSEARLLEEIRKKF